MMLKSEIPRDKSTIVVLSITITAFILLNAIPLLFLYYSGGAAILAILLGIAAIAFLYQSIGGTKAALRPLLTERAVGYSDEKLQNMVSRLSAKLGIPSPKVHVWNTPEPNAFATGITKKNSHVVFTTGLLDMLDDEEIETVAGHELIHIRSRDVVVMMMTYTGIIIADVAKSISSSILGALTRGSTRKKNDDGGGIFTLVIGLIAVITWIVTCIYSLSGRIVTIFLSRQREFYADRGSALLTRKPLKLASALEKLEGSIQHMNVERNHDKTLQRLSPYLIVSVNSLISDHPSTKKRVEKLKKIHEELSKKMQNE